LLYCHDKKAQSKISFNKNRVLEKQDVGVEEDDIFNYMTGNDQKMIGKVPWRGTHEKHHIFMQIFIEALTMPSSIVVDVITFTHLFSISIIV
jgi:hypothetical protein